MEGEEGGGGGGGRRVEGEEGSYVLYLQTQR